MCEITVFAAPFYCWWYQVLEKGLHCQEGKPHTTVSLQLLYDSRVRFRSSEVWSTISGWIHLPTGIDQQISSSLLRKKLPTVRKEPYSNYPQNLLTGFLRAIKTSVALFPSSSASLQREWCWKSRESWQCRKSSPADQAVSEATSHCHLPRSRLSPLHLSTTHLSWAGTSQAEGVRKRACLPDPKVHSEIFTS